MKVKSTYLQLFSRPKRVVSPPREALVVRHARRPTVAYYRFRYDAVGRDYDWPRCKKLSDAELAALLHDPRLEVHVLMVDGVPAGFAELDLQIEGEIELVYFGLVPEFIGQGLGRYFLQWTIDKAWSYQPRSFWLHTDTKDHPAALPNYLKAGLRHLQGRDQGEPTLSRPSFIAPRRRAKALFDFLNTELKKQGNHHEGK